ncbi:MAG: hypothetical protein HY926_11920 [Elusimicrobia bacterium]|nr:hypothetical protein [Elusimicrobiota bacterium]
MDSKREAAFLAGSAVFLVLVGCLVLAGKLSRDYETAKAQAYAQAALWPDIPRQQAQLMLERYGPPDRLTAQRMEWDERWPWKSVSVSAEDIYSPLTQSVACHIPPGKPAELARYPHGLMADAARGEMAARSDRETLNFLSLNLGMDIITGRRTPEAASRYFYKAVDLYYAGKSVPYAEKLVFDVPPAREQPRGRIWFATKL